MNRRLVTALVAALVSTAPALADTTIVLGGAMPAKGPDSRALVSFAERVKRDTGGKLAFDMSFDGQIVDFRSTLKALGDELVEAAQAYPAFYRSDLKVMNTFVDLGLAAPEPWAHTAAIAQTVLIDCPACDAEFAGYDVKPLAIAGSAPFNLICRNPVKDLADLQGKSIRAVSRNQQLVQVLGANPVTTVPSEVFEAMQRGQVDCVCSPLDWITAYGLAEVAKYVVDTPLTHDSSRMPLVINTEVWSSLSAEERQAILKNLPFLTAEATANNIADGEEGRKLALSHGIEFGDGGEAFVRTVKTFRDGELEQVRLTSKERGIEDADALVETYRKNYAKWSKILQESGGDRTKYEEALWTEIYSKLK